MGLGPPQNYLSIYIRKRKKKSAQEHTIFQALRANLVSKVLEGYFWENKVGYCPVVSKNEIKCVLRYSIYFGWLVHPQEYRGVLLRVSLIFWLKCRLILLIS